MVVVAMPAAARDRAAAAVAAMVAVVPLTHRNRQRITHRQQFQRIVGRGGDDDTRCTDAGTVGEMHTAHSGVVLDRGDAGCRLDVHAGGMCGSG